MIQILKVPIVKFALPFDAIWKRLLMHLIIDLCVGSMYLVIYNYNFYIYALFVIMFFIHDVTQSFVHMLIYIKLGEKYEWISHARERVIYSAVLHLAGTYIIYFSVLPLYIHYVFNVPFAETYQGLLNVWLIPIIFVVLSMVFAVAGEFFKNWKNSLAAETQLHAQMMGYKYEALRNQVNPHFLLDSFNVLKKLVYTSPVKANDFIQRISSLYRHVIDVKDKEFISLQEELDFMSVYLDLLRFRYDGRLTISIEVSAEADDIIIPLALQSLLEHAVENSVKETGRVSEIKVLKSGDHIEVIGEKDTPLGKVFLNNAGLKTIEQQYQFYSKRPVLFKETATNFSIRIPVLKQVI